MRWVVINGYDEMYSVSEGGDVFSRHCNRILKPGIASNGYPTVSLWCPIAEKGLTRTVHSLVAEAFLGPPPPGHEVRHKDGVRTNPRLENLEYGSRSDNIRDAVRHGTWVTHCGSRLPLEKREWIKQHRGTMSLRAMGRELGVTHQTVKLCLAEIGEDHALGGP